jgi:hypothetical protein
MSKRTVKRTVKSNNKILVNKAIDNIKKIKKVIPLISEYYDEDSFVNEKPLVKKLAKLLKPNQWLRVEPEPREYNSKMNYEQILFLKPNGIWASKGEWHMPKDKYLTLLEVDYSRILVLTTKNDYIEFEKKYCFPEKVSKIMKQDLSATKLNNKNRYNNMIKTLKNKTMRNNINKKVCYSIINWPKVANDYDGIAMVPNPRPYFPIDWNTVYSQYDHIWLKTYDVSSLIIWNQNINTPITKYKSLGKIQDIHDKAKKDKKSFDTVLLETIKQGIA